MSDHIPEQQLEQPPVTGEPDVDQALESLQGLETEPLEVHHDRLARVHEDLHRVLNSESLHPENPDRRA